MEPNQDLIRARQLQLERLLLQCQAAGVAPHPTLTQRADQLSRMVGPVAPPAVLWEIRLPRAAALLLWAMCLSGIVIACRLRACLLHRLCRPPRA